MLKQGRQSEADILQLDERYRIIAEYTVDWETWIDPAGNYLYCSPSCLRLTGYLPQDFIDDPSLLLRITHPDDVSALTKHLFHHDASEKPFEIIFRIQHADGGWRWIEHFCQPVVDAAGNFLGRRASNREVTDRVVLSQQLADAVSAAEKTTQAKSQFLSDMSHEIRTPLNAVIGSAMLLLQDIHEPKQRQRLNRIATSSQQLLALINNILDLAKIEAGKIVLEKIDFDLKEVLDTVQYQVEENLQTKDLSWHLDLHPSVPTKLSGDPLRLGQILSNFASNAAKFTEQGGLTLSVYVIAHNRGLPRLRFELHDTGCGFDPAKAETIFEPFEQADRSTTRKHGGTGLGLAICRQLAHLMEGEVGAESQIGKGSTFWLEANLLENQDQKAIVEQLQRSVEVTNNPTQYEPTQTNLSAYAQCKLLLVEDNPINQEVMLDILSSAGLHADMASNGQEALAMVSARSYDLILMDMQMPVMGGLEATKAIRRLPACKNTLILAMTANAYEADRQACLDAGMNDHIAKPILPDALYAILLHWLSYQKPCGLPLEKPDFHSGRLGQLA